MLKKLLHGTALIVSIITISGVISAVTMKVIQAQSKKAASSFTGHPDASRIEQPVVMTKHQMFSEDHTADVVAIQQVFAAYTFYTDTGNGEGVASLFTPDGVDQHVWEDSQGHFLPDFGIVAPGDEQKNMTPEGMRGSGCIQKGHDQIALYKRVGRENPLAWPAHGHHEIPSIMVKVSDDGQTAMLSSPYIILNSNAKGEVHITTGGYRVWFKKSSDSWLMSEMYVIFDHPSVTNACDVNGPLPREFAPRKRPSE